MKTYEIGKRYIFANEEIRRSFLKNVGIDITSEDGSWECVEVSSLGSCMTSEATFCGLDISQSTKNAWVVTTIEALNEKFVLEV